MATAACLVRVWGGGGALLETGPDFVIEDAAWTRVVRLSGEPPVCMKEGTLTSIDVQLRTSEHHRCTATYV